MLKKLRIPALAALLVALSLAGVQAASTLSATRLAFQFGSGMAATPALGTTQFTLAENWGYSLTSGSAANMANKIYVLTAATTTTVDLDSTLTLADGSTGSFSRIVMIAIKPATANAAALAVGGDFVLTRYLTSWVDDALTIPVHKTGGFAFIAPDATGVAVTASTGDQLTITVSGSDSFSLIVIGS